MDEQQPIHTPSATPPPEPAREGDNPYRAVVTAILIAAIIVGGALMGSALYVGDKVDALGLKLGDIGAGVEPGIANARPEPEAQGPVDLTNIVQGDDPVQGPADASVTIVEFSDYQCPFCRRYFESTFPEILAKYKGKIRYVFKDFPLPMHSDAPKAAEAAHCAGEQGKYWPYHDILFRNQNAMGSGALKQYASQLELDMNAFNRCVDSDKFADKVRKNMSQARKLGVSGTPTFFINGQRLVGAQPTSEFVALIEDELGK